MCGFIYENKNPRGQSRLLKIQIRRKYNYIKPQYLYPECDVLYVKMEFLKTIKINKNQDSQKIQLHWASIFVTRD